MADHNRCKALFDVITHPACLAINVALICHSGMIIASLALLAD